MLFSASKDHVINVWYTHNGERLGTYDEHNGAVWTIDVDCKKLFVFGRIFALTGIPSFPDHNVAQSRFLVSGSADNTMRLWSVQTGKCLYRWEFPTAVKRVAFSDDDEQVVCITEQRMGHQGAIRVFRINREGEGTSRECILRLLFANYLMSPCRPESKEPESFFNPIGSKAVVCAFSYIPNLIITGHESGKVALFDYKTGEEVQNNERAHGDVVTDLQLSPDRSYFVTSSKDKCARVCPDCPFPEL